jgi:hypothetical protein
MVSFYNGKNKDEHAEITTKLEVSLNSLSITADNNFAVVGTLFSLLIPCFLTYNK